MKRYRIYTESFPNLPLLTSQLFDGFTIYEATGYWMGKPEKSAVIEIIGDDNDKGRVDLLCHNIWQTSHQESVMITAEPVTPEFVSAPISVAEA
jgi:hypothetical protein